MKLKSFLPTAASVILLAVLVAAGAITPHKFGNHGEINQKTSTQSEAVQAVKKIEEAPMKGVWVTNMELNMTGESDKSQKGFYNKFSKIAKTCKNHGFNTLIVQVRPFCDALYKSEYFPYSHVLTGEQGKNPGYDPLEMMCEICKYEGLKIHAWINPYRVSLNNVPEKLSPENPASVHGDYVIKTDSTVILDPSNAEARELIIDGIKEILENYDVDGIQFDDYFYPLDIEGKDRESFEKYRSTLNDKTAVNIEQWRTVNVNTLIAQAYIAVHKSGKNAVFGVSPQGNLENNSQLCADVKSWCEVGGYVDYICPQLYFSLENPALSFENALESWTKLNLDKNVRMYAGLAGYKAGTDADEGTWKNSDSILKIEYETLKKNGKVSGMMLYSYSSLENSSSKKEIENLTKALAK